ncbi:MAG: transporter substrate-binding domain-containing protein [Oceanospirillaceae bacterium]
MTIKTIAAISSCLVALTATSLQADTLKIGIGAEPYPPFSSADAAGNWKGWEIDIIGALCSEAKLDCKITPVAWDGLIAALNSNKVDVIMASLSITQDRAKQIDFTNKYYSTPSVVVGDKNITMDATPGSLKGKILGVQMGSIHRAYALKHFPGAELKEYQTQDEANQDLVAGRIDATQADSLPMADFIASESGTNCCEVKGEVAPDIAVFGPGIGAGVRKSQPELTAKLNAAIDTIRSNGKYEEISKRYFNFDIYGG